MDTATNATQPRRQPGVWTEAMKVRLAERYDAARQAQQLPELARELGVGLYQLYVQAHRMGLARHIRKRTAAPEAARDVSGTSPGGLPVNFDSRGSETSSTSSKDDFEWADVKW